MSKKIVFAVGAVLGFMMLSLGNMFVDNGLADNPDTPILCVPYDLRPYAEAPGLFIPIYNQGVYITFEITIFWMPPDAPGETYGPCTEYTFEIKFIHQNGYVLGPDIIGSVITLGDPTLGYQQTYTHPYGQSFEVQGFWRVQVTVNGKYDVEHGNDFDSDLFYITGWKLLD